MILTAEQQKSLREAAEPLVKWMREECHPHTVAIVDGMRVEVLESLATDVYPVEG